MTCGYVGCEARAIARMRSKFGRAWWYGCADHAPAMAAALMIGQPVDSGQVTTEELTA